MNIDVLQTSKDVYTVYMDIMGGVSRVVPIGADLEPPDGAFPNTFVGMDQLKAAFPGCKLNIKGDLMEDNKRVSKAPSNKEIDAYLVNEKPYGLPETSPVMQSAEVSTLLLVFEQKVGEYKRATRKKKELAKAYCNGMGRAIKMIYPEVEGRLKQIVEGVKEEQDLL